MATTKLITAEDLWLMDDDEQRYELVRGELVSMSPAGGSHGQIGMTVATYINTFASPRSLGYTFPPDTGFLLARNPDTVRSPDVAFVRSERLPDGPPASFIPLAPDIAVEIISPTDRLSEIQSKIFEYLDAGVALVWLIDPPNHTVTIYRDKQSALVRHAGDTIHGEEILPGFELPVASIFEPWVASHT